MSKGSISLRSCALGIDGSQTEDKKTNDPPIAPVQKKDPSKSIDIVLILWILFGVFMSIGFGTFVWLVVIPEGQKTGIRYEMEHEAAIKGPKVLEEILEELRLLRVAVENQR
jgi:hypothetical protein